MTKKIDVGVLDELLAGCERPEDLLGDAGLMKELKVRLMERMLGAVQTAQLGYEAGAEPPPQQANRRDGIATRRVKGSDGEVPLAVPRDRDGSFEPELVRKGQTRIDGIDDKIVGLHAAGLSVRDIQAHLEELCGPGVSPDLISRVTDAMLEEVREWQHRALDRMFPIILFDALRVKIRDANSRTVRNKAVYIALGVTHEVNRPAFAGGLRGGVHDVHLCVVGGFGLDGWDTPDRTEEPAVVEPMDPFKGGELHRLEAAPGAPPADHLGLEEPDHRLHERVVERVPHRAD